MTDLQDHSPDDGHDEFDELIQRAGGDHILDRALTVEQEREFSAKVAIGGTYLEPGDMETVQAALGEALFDGGEFAHISELDERYAHVPLPALGRLLAECEFLRFKASR